MLQAIRIPFQASMTIASQSSPPPAQSYQARGWHEEAGSVQAIPAAPRGADSLANSASNADQVAECLQNRVARGDAADADIQLLDASFEKTHNLRRHITQLVILLTRGTG